MFRTAAHCDTCRITFPSDLPLGRRPRADRAAAVCPRCHVPAQLLDGTVITSHMPPLAEARVHVGYDAASH